MQKGFTMAEVLITLGIIGVVAAMTLPTVMNNSRNKALETALKKNYSVIEQALNMYYAQTGERLLPKNLGNDELKSILVKYMDVLYDCGLGTDVHKACIKHYVDASRDSTNYKTYNGQSNIELRYFDDGQFILNDGSLILLENFGSGSVVYISVDVNGYQKNPNRLGLDLFMFQIVDNGRLLPMGASGTYYYSANDEYCSKTSTNAMNGAGCTYKALTDDKYFSKLK